MNRVYESRAMPEKRNNLIARSVLTPMFRFFDLEELQKPCCIRFWLGYCQWIKVLAFLTYIQGKEAFELSVLKLNL